MERHPDTHPPVARAQRLDQSESLNALAQVAGREGLAGLESKLSLLRAWLNDGLSAVEAKLGDLREVPQDASVERRVARQILGLPGKRIRPVCVLLAARLNERDTDPLVRDIAVASELVHSATLLHDDVIDLGAERRGSTCARIVYSNAASILGGDFLLTRALRLVHQHQRPELLASLLNVIEEMVAAEALQLQHRGNLVADPEVYLKVISGKTAALFRWALDAGSRAADLPEDVGVALARFGHGLGMGFQLVDDLLDLTGSDQLGKDLFADLAEGKMTYPLILAAQADADVAARLRALLGATDAAAASDLGPWIRDAAVRTGALERARALAYRFVNDATEHLSALPESTERRALEAVADAALDRVR